MARPAFSAFCSSHRWGGDGIFLIITAMNATSIASIEDEAPTGGLGVTFLVSATAFCFGVAAFPGCAAAFSGCVTMTVAEKALALPQKAANIPS